MMSEKTDGLDLVKLSEVELQVVVQLFKALSDSTRAQIIYALIDREYSVNHLAERLGVSQSSVSQHLRRLRDIGLVSYHKHKNHVHYSIHDIHVRRILMEAVDHAQGHLPRIKKGRPQS